MSTTVQIDRAIADALSAAADLFPVEDLERMPAQMVDDLLSALPDGGGRWVAASLEGEPAVAVGVITSFDVASALFDSDGNAPKLVEVLGAATAQLDVELEAPATGRAPSEPPPGSDEAWTVFALELHSAGEHVATIYISQLAATEPTDATAFPQLAAKPIATVGAAAEGSTSGLADARALSVIRSVEMQVTAELGRSTMTVRELLTLSTGSVIELDKAAGSPVDLLVNGTIIARGEVVVIDEEYGIRVSEIIGSPEDL